MNNLSFNGKIWNEYESLSSNSNIRKVPRCNLLSFTPLTSYHWDLTTIIIFSVELIIWLWIPMYSIPNKTRKNLLPASEITWRSKTRQPLALLGNHSEGIHRRRRGGCSHAHRWDFSTEFAARPTGQESRFRSAGPESGAGGQSSNHCHMFE